MTKKELEPVIIQQVMTEQNQGHETRRRIFVELEKELKRPVVSFFTSFRFPVMIENTDADMLEGGPAKDGLIAGFNFVHKFSWWRWSCC